VTVRRFIATVGIVSVSALGLTSGPLAPAGAAACYTGTWQLSDASASRVIKTPYGRLTVTPKPGGAVKLTLGAAGTWSLDVNKSFNAAGTGPLGTASGTVAVDAVANGTFRGKSNGSLVFRISAASGNATFNGTVNGTPTTYSYSVIKSDVQAYLGIKGKAVPTCSAGPHLRLSFRTVTLTFF
jgi:hypothetical protein